MLHGDFTATRDDPLDLSGAPPFAPAEPVARAVEPAPQPPRGRRLRALVPGTLVSIAVHIVLTIFGIMAWRSMVRDLTAPEPISVELVSSVPGEGPSGGKAGGTTAGPTGGASNPEATKTEQKKADGGEPRHSALDDALAGLSSNDPLAKAAERSPAPPAPKPTPPEANEPRTPPKMDPFAGRPDAPATSAPATSAPTAPATPTDMKTAPDGQPAPALAAPPPDPRQAATQLRTNEPANTSDAKVSTPKPPPPTPAAKVPEVLSVPDSDESVPAAPSTASTVRAENPAEQAAQQALPPDPNAQLAAALPMGTFQMPSSFRSILSGQGPSQGDEYKGEVYGAFNRSPDAARIMQDAERRKLKGVVVVALTVGDRGGIDTLSVVQSSGQAVVDDMALNLVRSSAPFPPPPPGSPRSFTPAIVIGSP